MYKISHQDRKDWKLGTLTKVSSVPTNPRKKKMNPMVKTAIVEMVIFAIILFIHVEHAYKPLGLNFDQKKFEAKMREKYIRAALDEARTPKPVNRLSISNPSNLNYDEQQIMDNGFLNCRGIDVAGSPWVNYLILAPSSEGVTGLKRLLRSIENDKDVTGLCGLRVCIAFGGDSNEEEIIEISRPWSKESNIEIFFIPTYSVEPRARLHESIIWLAQFWKWDIVFVVNPMLVVPQGFSGIIRDSTKVGKAVFMPYFLERKTNGWSKTNFSELENVGMFVSDAVSIELYSTESQTPLISSSKNKLYVNMPKIYGLVNTE